MKSYIKKVKQETSFSVLCKIVKQWFVILICIIILPSKFVYSQTNKQDSLEYKNVNSFNIQSLQGFLKAYPSSEYSQDAKVALELLTLVKKIKDGLIKADYIIPFSKIGGVEGWALPGEMEFSGRSNGKLFWKPFNGGKTPDVNSFTFGYGGVPEIADNDGSIIAFKTNGEVFEFYGGVKFVTPNDETVFFGVLKGIGFVHLKGKATVTPKDEVPVVLK